MLRFAANLGFLWSERPLLKRIEAAAKAGFGAVEMHWPYEVAAADVRRACERYGVRLLGINTVPTRAEPDEGEVAYGAVFDRLERLGYRGWVGCEYRPRARTEDGLCWAQTLGVTLSPQSRATQ